MKIVSDEEELCKAASAVYELADAVVRRYRRKDAPGDPDDWRQEAALAVVEGIRLRGRPVTDRGYHYEAARLTVALAISRALAVVHVAEHAAGRAREFQARIPMVGCGHGALEGGKLASNAIAERAVDLPGGANPSARVEAAERARARRALLAHLGGVVARMPRGRDRDLLAKMLGLRGAEPMEPDEAAWSVMAGVGAAHGATRRLAEAVRGDRRARRLRRNAA